MLTHTVLIAFHCEMKYICNAITKSFPAMTKILKSILTFCIIGIICAMPGQRGRAQHAESGIH